MQVQFLAGVKKDRSDKVARLKEFELLAIKLNDNNIEVIATASEKPSPEPSPMKSRVESDELLASYIARLECLEDLEKDMSFGYNNNETSSSTPKANPHGPYPSLASLPIVNTANYAYGMPPILHLVSNRSFNHTGQIWPHRLNRCRVPVRPMHWRWCPISLCHFLSCQIQQFLLFLIQLVALDLIIIRQ
jgi:hypothetical protein